MGFSFNQDGEIMFEVNIKIKERKKPVFKYKAVIPKIEDVVELLKKKFG